VAVAAAKDGAGSNAGRLLDGSQPHSMLAPRVSWQGGGSVCRRVLRLGVWCLVLGDGGSCSNCRRLSGFEATRPLFSRSQGGQFRLMSFRLEAYDATQEFVICAARRSVRPVT
jgi:hypothetical protein